MIWAPTEPLRPSAIIMEYERIVSTVDMTSKLEDLERGLRFSNDKAGQIPARTLDPNRKVKWEGARTVNDDHGSDRGLHLYTILPHFPPWCLPPVQLPCRIHTQLYGKKRNVDYIRKFFTHQFTEEIFFCL